MSLVLCDLLRHWTWTLTWYVVSGFKTFSIVFVLLLWVSSVFQMLSPMTLADRIKIPSHQSSKGWPKCLTQLMGSHSMPTRAVEHPVARKTSSSSPVAKRGPTCSRHCIRKKQRAFSWAASRSTLHPQRSQLSTEDSVLCIQSILLQRKRGKGKESGTLHILRFQRTQELP